MSGETDASSPAAPCSQKTARTPGLRIVAFNHHFEQDLDAIELALGLGDVLVSVPYQLLLRRARRSLDEKYFSELLDPPASSAEYQSYCAWLERHIRLLITLTKPNMVLLPSDTFFYVRPGIEEFRRNGIPCVVLQKETTITDAVLDHLAPEIGSNLPFISDQMLVCSERQRLFWVKAGADQEKIQVIGQPRFDVYKNLNEGEVLGAESLRNDKKKVLFLSFDSRAYIDADTGNSSGATWDSFKKELVTVLDAAGSSCEVTVKQHPQERADSVDLEGRFSVAPRDADTRDLIRRSDAVVGFQTTALFEAALAGKEVLYPAWGPQWVQHVDLLIPFHDMEPAVTWVKTPEELLERLNSETVRRGDRSEAARSVIAEHLGEIDGRSGERAVQLLRSWAGDSQLVGAWGALGPRGGLAARFAADVIRETARLSVVIAQVPLSLIRRTRLGSPGLSSLERFARGLKRALRSG